MSHTYGTLDEFKLAFDQTGASWSGNDATLLDLLESASRRVDAYTMRSRFGSGFGPRTGTNRYDWWGASEVLLGDDLLSVTEVLVSEGTGGAQGTATNETDFYLRPYDETPKRELFFHGLTSVPIAPGHRVLSIEGSWGYQSETVSLGGSLQLASSSATAGTLTAGSASPGMTILTGTEQVYVTAATGGTALTIVRGANGTTAAAGTAAASYYTYPAEVVDTTIRVAMRRWRMNQAGVSGEMGGFPYPVTTNRDTEMSLLRAIHHLRVYSA